MALQWLKGAAKNWEIDHILNNSNILKQSLSINLPHTVMCKFVLLLSTIFIFYFSHTT